MIIGLDLIQACAPHVAPTTMQEIVRVESGGDPFVINIVGDGPHRFASAAQAIERTQRAVHDGRNVAMGLMQVTTRTAARIGYTIEQMFDPCTNLKAGAQVIAENYQAAATIHGEGQTALQAALSAYNTGNFQAGFSNGYVAQFYRAATFPSAGSPPRAAATLSPYSASPTVYTRQEKQHDEPHPGGGSSGSAGNGGNGPGGGTGPVARDSGDQLAGPDRLAKPR